METVWYLQYTPHVGWFWTHKRVTGLDVRRATQNFNEVMRDE